MQRKYSSQITKEHYNKEITVAGWIQDIRNLGGISFILLRDREGILQITAIKKMNKDLFKQLTELPRESVVSIKGKVQENKEVINGYEILPIEMQILSVAKTPLPLGIVDKVSVDFDTRLDNRFLDLRKSEVLAIFKIRSTVLKAIREKLDEEGFIEIHTPKIVAVATEGGTNLFSVQYFENKVFLNQSPQLFKQIMMATSFDKVYEVGACFRAEEHNTVRHLNEFTSIDIEIAFADEEDAMQVLERVIYNSIKKIIAENQKELKILNVDLKLPDLPFPRVDYEKCLQIVKEKIPINFGDDFSMEANKILAEKFKEFYFITKWPLAIKPFYAQPYDEKLSRGFDLMFGEKEITSGAQRVHDVSLLKKRLEEQGLNPNDFEFYIKAFEYGMPPHAGWGLGLERIVMILTQRENIRECVLFPRDRRRLVP